MYKFGLFLSSETTEKAVVLKMKDNDEEISVYYPKTDANVQAIGALTEGQFIILTVTEAQKGFFGVSRPRTYGSVVGNDKVLRKNADFSEYDDLCETAKLVGTLPEDADLSHTPEAISRVVGIVRKQDDQDPLIEAANSLFYDPGKIFIGKVYNVHQSQKGNWVGSIRDHKVFETILFQKDPKWVKDKTYVLILGSKSVLPDGKVLWNRVLFSRIIV